MNKNLTTYCVDCGRPTEESCSGCGLPICNRCIEDKREKLCDDCYYEDNTWMMEDTDYL